jgi:hypothetical protein
MVILVYHADDVSIMLILDHQLAQQRFLLAAMLQLPGQRQENQVS